MSSNWHPLNCRGKGAISVQHVCRLLWVIVSIVLYEKLLFLHWIHGIWLFDWNCWACPSICHIFLRVCIVIRAILWFSLFALLTICEVRSVEKVDFFFLKVKCLCSLYSLCLGFSNLIKLWAAIHICFQVWKLKVIIQRECIQSQVILFDSGSWENWSGLGIVRILEMLDKFGSSYAVVFSLVVAEFSDAI